VKIDKPSDTFALGVTAHQAWFGDDPFGKQKFVSKIDENYLKFLKGRQTGLRAEGRPGAHARTKRMVNGLMDPNPKSPAHAEARRSSTKVFTDERVGGERIREFLTAPDLQEAGRRGHRLPAHQRRPHRSEGGPEQVLRRRLAR
jgi:hypothetical protein